MLKMGVAAVRSGAARATSDALQRLARAHTPQEWPLHKLLLWRGVLVAPCAATAPPTAHGAEGFAAAGVALRAAGKKR